MVRFNKTFILKALRWDPEAGVSLETKSLNCSNGMERKRKTTDPRIPTFTGISSDNNE